MINLALLLEATVKKIICGLIILLCNLKIANCQDSHFTISTGGTINVSDFYWSIAGNLEGKSPNILSELVFQKITSLGIYLEGTYKPLKYLELNVYYQKNNVVSGDGTDADYKDDNRINAIYYESFSSNKGILKVFKAGGNFYFLKKGDLRLKTGISYATNIQKFYILNTDFANLNSTYTAKWKGAKLSIGGSFKIFEKLSILASLSYGLIKYNSQANWNLIEIFMHPISFEQYANGRSTDQELGLDYKLNSFITLKLSGTAGNIKAFNGVDNSYLQNNTQISTQFNGSNNSFHGFILGTSISF